MKVSGLTLARYAVKFDYPLVESMRSIWDLCDEYLVNIGADDEDTYRLLIREFPGDKLKILRPKWNDDVRERGRIFSEQTNYGLDRCTGEWIIYLQADEVIHEKDLPVLQAALARELDNRDIDGFEVPFIHFYGRYDVIQDHPRKWHTKTIRIVRKSPFIRSWDDAAGFRVMGGPRELMLRTQFLPVTVYHYGWCRHPQYMLEKQRFLERYYHTDEWVRDHYGHLSPADIYQDLGHLAYFQGTHPRVMQARVAAQSWTWDPQINRQPPTWLRHWYLKWFYKWEVKLGSLRRAIKKLGYLLIGRQVPR